MARRFNQIAFIASPTPDAREAAEMLMPAAGRTQTGSNPHCTGTNS
jgi:hypothetical protein